MPLARIVTGKTCDRWLVFPVRMIVCRPGVNPVRNVNSCDDHAAGVGTVGAEINRHRVQDRGDLFARAEAGGAEGAGRAGGQELGCLVRLIPLGGLDISVHPVGDGGLPLTVRMEAGLVEDPAVTGNRGS